METFDSLVKVTHGATVLLNIGDPVFALPEIDGEQVLDLVHLVRSAGIQARPQANEMHTVTLSLVKEYTSVEAALKAAFAAARTAPRTMADVSITFADLSGIQIKNAAIGSWSAGTDAQLGRTILHITGGELVNIPAP